jgi:8-oxo-dGTP diphosphatase
MKLVAKILIYNPRGQILVLQRSDTHPHFPEHLDLPGGEVEKDEQPGQAVIREVQEETGLDIASNTINMAFEKLFGEHIKHILYISRLSHDPSISLSWEHIHYYWLTPEQIINEPLPKGVDPYYKDVVEHLAQA